MPISIIVEDGTGKEDANSYVSVSELISYASNRGVELSDSDSTATLLIKASDYLESKNYKGEKSYLLQALSWPRKNAYIDSNSESPFPDNLIPKQIKIAQMQLALIVESGVDLMPTLNNSEIIIRDKVGPLETEYANPLQYGASLYPEMPQIDSLLAPLVSSGGAALFRTVRGGYG